MVAAAFVPTPPLLVPEIAGGSADRDDDLRTACRDAVATLAGADRLVVVGSAPQSRAYEGCWDPRPFGVPGPAVTALPYALGIGQWLTRDLDLPTTFQGVADALDAAAISDEGRVALLVCGDGSARRDEKAPGHVDPRAEPFDEGVLDALRSGDPERLLALDPLLADELLATGVRPWHLLARAAGNRRTARVTYAKAPYGVMYVVGTWA